MTPPRLRMGILKSLPPFYLYLLPYFILRKLTSAFLEVCSPLPVFRMCSVGTVLYADEKFDVFVDG